MCVKCHSHLPQPKPPTQTSTSHSRRGVARSSPDSHSQQCTHVLGTRAQTTELRGERHKDPSPCHSHGTIQTKSAGGSEGQPRSQIFCVKAHSLGSVAVVIQDPVTLSILGQHGTDRPPTKLFSQRTGGTWRNHSNRLFHIYFLYVYTDTSPMRLDN